MHTVSGLFCSHLSGQLPFLSQFSEIKHLKTGLSESVLWGNSAAARVSGFETIWALEEDSAASEEHSLGQEAPQDYCTPLCPLYREKTRDRSSSLG